MNIADTVSALFSTDEEVRSCLEGQILPRRSDGNYLQRLVIVWNEDFRVGVGADAQINKLQHVFTAGIDTKNQVYIDCNKRLICLKIVLSTLFRPIVGTAFTLYSLSMIPIFKAIASARSGEITRSEAFDRSVKSLADIVRIPLYEVVLIVVGCAALLIAPFAPSTLYRFRELIGKIERAKCYGKFKGSFALAPCFQSRELKQVIKDFGFWKTDRVNNLDVHVRLTNFPDTDYGDHSIEKMQEFLGEENFTRLFVRPAARDILENDHYYLHQSFIETSRMILDEGQLNQLKNSFAQRALIHYARAQIKSIKNGGNLARNAVFASPAASSMDVEAIRRNSRRSG
jgi:hypothetical protein